MLPCIQDILRDQIKDRECVHVFVRWAGQYINTTGLATDANILKWTHLTAERNRLLYIALGSVLNILQKHSSNANISTNANGLNNIAIDFDGFLLRHAAEMNNEKWTGRELAALLELTEHFNINFIVGDSLNRYCVDIGRPLRVVKIDDGGC